MRRLNLIVALLLTGCGSSDSGDGGPSPDTGSLTVTITTPAGVTPAVEVTGPGGYHQTLTATQTLTDLTVGSYAVTAADVLAAHPIVGTFYTATVTGGSATVSAGATATATVSYAAQPGSGALWVVNADASVVAYTAAQLAASTAAAPATAVGLGASTTTAVAFDPSGNVWLSDASLDALVELTASQLGQSGSPTPAVTLSDNNGSLNNPRGLAFDASGNLWVANNVLNTVVEFTASQLQSTGSPTPAVTLSANNGSLDAPTALAFDASGSLWLVNLNGNTVVKFTAIQLQSTGSPTPAVTLSDNNGSLFVPSGLAFDAGGNLWVANRNTVVEFTPSQLQSTGSPTPTVTLSDNNGSLDDPIGLAFDASGDLWVANFSRTVVKFAPSQLVTSGAPTPDVIVSGSSLSAPIGLAFNPHAATLPLK